MLAYLNQATQNAAETPQGNYKITYIDAEKIVPNEKNFYSIEGIEELANSLTVSNNIAPLDVVANDDGTYRLISGERRLSATLYRIQRGELESAELPCHILPAFKSKGALTADQVEMLAIVLANNYRQKTALDQLNEVQALEPIARAIYEEEKENKNLSISDGRNIKFRAFFAERILNISDAALKRLQALNNLTQEAKEAFDNGVIGKTVAMALASLTDHAQNAFLEAIHRGEFSSSMADLETFKKQIEASNKEDAIDPIQSEERTCDIENTGSMLPESPPSTADTSIEEGEHEENELLQDTEEEAVLAAEEIEDDKIKEILERAKKEGNQEVLDRARDAGILLEEKDGKVLPKNSKEAESPKPLKQATSTVVQILVHGKTVHRQRYRIILQDLILQPPKIR